VASLDFRRNDGVTNLNHRYRWRWYMYQDADTGTTAVNSNSSDLRLYRYMDDGSSDANALTAQVSRATGIWNFSFRPTVAGIGLVSGSGSGNVLPRWNGTGSVLTDSGATDDSNTLQVDRRLYTRNPSITSNVVLSASQCEWYHNSLSTDPSRWMKIATFTPAANYGSGGSKLILEVHCGQYQSHYRTSYYIEMGDRQSTTNPMRYYFRAEGAIRDAASSGIQVYAEDTVHGAQTKSYHIYMYSLTGATGFTGLMVTAKNTGYGRSSVTFFPNPTVLETTPPGTLDFDCASTAYTPNWSCYGYQAGTLGSTFTGGTSVLSAFSIGGNLAVLSTITTSSPSGTLSGAITANGGVITSLGNNFYGHGGLVASAYTTAGSIAFLDFKTNNLLRWRLWKDVAGANEGTGDAGYAGSELTLTRWTDGGGITTGGGGSSYVLRITRSNGYIRLGGSTAPTVQLDVTGEINASLAIKAGSDPTTGGLYDRSLTSKTFLGTNSSGRLVETVVTPGTIGAVGGSGTQYLLPRWNSTGTPATLENSRVSDNGTLIHLNGNSQVSGTFLGTGAATFNSTLSVGTNATVGGTLGVTGVATFGNTVTASGRVTGVGLRDTTLPTKALLGTNSSGDLIESTINAAGGADVPINGTANTLAMFTAAKSIGNSNLIQSAAGDILTLTSGTAFSVLKLDGYSGAGASTGIQFAQLTNARFTLYASNGLSGDLILNRFDNAGANPLQVFKVFRATGIVEFNETPTIDGRNVASLYAAGLAVTAAFIPRFYASDGRMNDSGLADDSVNIYSIRPLIVTPSASVPQVITMNNDFTGAVGIAFGRKDTNQQRWQIINQPGSSSGTGVGYTYTPGLLQFVRYMRSEAGALTASQPFILDTVATFNVNVMAAPYRITCGELYADDEVEGKYFRLNGVGVGTDWGNFGSDPTNADTAVIRIRGNSNANILRYTNEGTLYLVSPTAGIGGIVLSRRNTLTSAQNFEIYVETSTDQPASGVNASYTLGFSASLKSEFASNTPLTTGRMFGWTNSEDILMSRARTPEAMLASTTDRGFLYLNCINSGAAAPGGTPTYRGPGAVPVIYNKGDDSLYVYNGGWKKQGATGGAGGPGTGTGGYFPMWSGTGPSTTLTGTSSLFEGATAVAFYKHLWVSRTDASDADFNINAPKDYLAHYKFWRNGLDGATPKTRLRWQWQMTLGTTESFVDGATTRAGGSNLRLSCYNDGGTGEIEVFSISRNDGKLMFKTEPSWNGTLFSYVGHTHNYQPLDSDLTALAGFNDAPVATGYAKRTGTGVWVLDAGTGGGGGPGSGTVNNIPKWGTTTSLAPSSITDGAVAGEVEALISGGASAQTLRVKSTSTGASADPVLAISARAEQQARLEWQTNVGGSGAGSSVRKWSLQTEANSGGITGTGRSGRLTLYSFEDSGANPYPVIDFYRHDSAGANDGLVYIYRKLTVNGTSIFTGVATFTAQSVFNAVGTFTTGVSPFTVASQRKVTNLNADFLDDKNASDFALAHTHPYVPDTRTVKGSWSVVNTVANPSGQLNNDVVLMLEGDDSLGAATPPPLGKYYGTPPVDSGLPAQKGWYSLPSADGGPTPPHAAAWAVVDETKLSLWTSSTTSLNWTATNPVLTMTHAAGAGPVQGELLSPNANTGGVGAGSVPIFRYQIPYYVRIISAGSTSSTISLAASKLKANSGLPADVITPTLTGGTTFYRWPANGNPLKAGYNIDGIIYRGDLSDIYADFSFDRTSVDYPILITWGGPEAAQLKAARTASFEGFSWTATSAPHSNRLSVHCP